MKNKKIIFFTTLFLLLFSFITVSAKEFPSVENTSVKKEWTIKFTQNVNKDSVNENTLKVLDSKKNIIPINYRVDNNMVYISPKTQYDYDTLYTITISKDLPSSKGEKLKSDIVKQFKTEKKSSIENNDLDMSIQWGFSNGFNRYGYQFITTKDLTLEPESGIFFYIGDEKGLNDSINYKNLSRVIESDTQRVFEKGDTIMGISGAWSQRKTGQSVYYKIIKGVKSSYGDLTIYPNATTSEWKYCGKLPEKTGTVIDNYELNLGLGPVSDENPEDFCMQLCNEGSQDIDLTGWYIKIPSLNKTLPIKAGTKLKADGFLELLTGSYDNSYLDENHILIDTNKLPLSFRTGQILLYNENNQIVTLD